MAFEIILAPAAATTLKNLAVPIRTGVTKALEVLRVGDIRVFYDVTETQVQVLAIVTKAEAQSWLDEAGTPAQGPEGGGAGGGEG